MKNLVLSFLLVLISSSLTSVEAQNSSYVHLDKSFYVTGEIIWYKLYLPAFMDGNNTVIKTTLVDAAGKNIGNHFNKTDATTFIEGYYKLPFDISSGVYSVIFSGTRGKNLPEEMFAEIYVPIYNDLQTVPTTEQINEVNLASYNSTYNPINEMNVAIDLGKETYSCREQVNATVKISDANGNPIKSNISVVVREAEAAEATQTSSLFTGYDIDPQSGKFMNQLYVKGNYVKGENEIVPKEIIGAYAGKENKLYFAVPDLLGNFHLEIPYFYGSKSIQYFPYIDDEKDLQVTQQQIGSANNLQLAYSQEIIDYIKLSRQRKKLYQRYTSVESNLQPKEYEVDIAPFVTDKEFDITEYKPFENVASFLKEVKTPVRMKKKKGKFEGAMYMPTKWKSYSDYAENDPIYVVNGFLTRDSDYIGNLDLDLVTNLSMLYTPKKIRDAYKIFGSHGVVGVTVKSKEIMIPESEKADIYNISGLLPEAEFPAYDPSEDSNDPFQPFFRPQLFWDGNITTNDSGSANISFYQSDDVSTFVIEVVAQSADGKISRTSKTYQSVWQQP